MRDNEFYHGGASAEEYAELNIKKVLYPERKKFTKYKVFDNHDNKIYEGYGIEAEEEILKNFFSNKVEATSFFRGRDQFLETPNFPIIKIFDKNGFDKAKKEYYVYKNALREVFKNDLKEEYCPLTLKPAFDIIFAQAWEERHSSGYDEVIDEFDKLVDLLENVIAKI